MVFFDFVPDISKLDCSDFLDFLFVDLDLSGTELPVPVSVDFELFLLEARPPEDFSVSDVDFFFDFSVEDFFVVVLDKDSTFFLLSIFIPSKLTQSYSSS